MTHASCIDAVTWTDCAVLADRLFGRAELAAVGRLRVTIHQPPAPVTRKDPNR